MFELLSDTCPALSTLAVITVSGWNIQRVVTTFSQWESGDESARTLLPPSLGALIGTE